ncbi:MAG: histidinol-phosphate transaminase [Trueperaceae bacterium]|nr:MAG: histidinol-phosphate transaminase [Trueperaceae bacterium]
MCIRPAIRSEAPYRFRAEPAGIKLDQNESPFDLTEPLKSRIFERLSKIPFNRYPEIHAQGLRRKIARHFEWPEDGIVVAGGSNVLVQSLVITAGLGQKVLTVTPTFPVYAMQARLLDAQLIELPLTTGFELPVAALERELSSGRGVLFLANPAAPTGNLHRRTDLLSLIEAAATDWLVVIDEAYCQFAASDYLEVVRQHRHVVSLRTFSKAFGLGGVRLGFALTTPDVAENVQKVMMPFAVSSLQQAVGEVMLDEIEAVTEVVEQISSERARLWKALSRLENITVFPSETNFLLIKVPDPARVHRELLDRGVLIRRQDHLPGLQGCVRVTIGSIEENALFLSAFQEVVMKQDRYDE